MSLPWGTPLPRQEVCKVSDTETLGLDFGFGLGWLTFPAEVFRGGVMSSAGDFGPGSGFVLKEMIFLLTFVSVVP
jgi:hypothetical protein